MSEYTTEVKLIDELSGDARESMVELYLNHYDGSSREKVLHDLSNKREALILYFGETLVGFTTMQVYSHQWQGKKVQIVYSGDTIVEREHWGQQALAFSWISRMAQIKAEAPDSTLYWFVIIKGHRTFKYLPTFGKTFYPHWSIDRSDLKPLADELAIEKFGDLYNSETGLIEFDQSQGHLKNEIAYPTEEELNKESVQFFMSKNPNYLKGHELVCLCELEEENMKPLTKRIFRKAYNDEVMEPVA